MLTRHFKKNVSNSIHISLYTFIYRIPICRLLFPGAKSYDVDLIIILTVVFCKLGLVPCSIHQIDISLWNTVVKIVIQPKTHTNGEIYWDIDFNEVLDL